MSSSICPRHMEKAHFGGAGMEEKLLTVSPNPEELL
jgi:hypothetical protein